MDDWTCRTFRSCSRTFRTCRWSPSPTTSVARLLPSANWVGTVYHGLPRDLLPYCERPSRDYLPFLGRICPEKRLDRAITIARRADIRLKIAAKVDNADRAYFEEHIQPLLNDPLIEFIGEIGDAEKPAFLGNAWAMLFPIDWPEPFGLVPVMGSGVADRPTADQPVSPVDIGVVLVAEDRDHQALRRPLRWTAYPVPAGVGSLRPRFTVQRADVSL